MVTRSRLIARLEARGVLNRRAASDDRRAVTVHLTGSGSGLVDRVVEVHARAVHEAMTSTFAEAEHVALPRTLSQIGRYLARFLPERGANLVGPIIRLA